jgi:pSer/pThr/pTyr-binding forkhead associated (FHA) protein
MASVCIPIKFQVLEGDHVVREQMLNEPIIKIGKLASSHLRLDEATVSRMHAVIEMAESGSPQLIDLGSTRGTLVNGRRVHKATLKSGDEVQFGNSRVVVTFVPQNDNAEATPPPEMQVAQPQTAIAGGPPPAALAASPRPEVPPAPPASPAHLAPDVELLDGSHAIEVQSLYRGVVTNTRHLVDVAGESAGQAKGLLAGGAGLVLLALAIFLGTTVATSREKARYDAFLREGKAAKEFSWQRHSPVLDAVVFGGLALGLSLVYAGLKRRTRENPDFVIGAGTRADAPVGPELIGAQRFALVSASGGELRVNVTPAMSGEVRLDGRAMPLAQLVAQRGPSFSLGDRGSARIDCGATTFLIRATPKPRSMPAPFLAWRWSEQTYNVGTAAALLLFLLMVFSVPPDPKAIALDLFNADNKFVNTFLAPPVEKEEELPWLKKSGQDQQGGTGKRHKGDEGVMGKKTAKNKEGLVGIKGPKENTDPHLAKQQAEESARNAGFLGVLRAAEGSHVASIFGRETALGNDAANILGGLMGNELGEAYGIGGFGLVGSGSGGGGTGEGTLGLGTLGTFGKGGGGGKGAGYGRGVGGLGGGLAARKIRGPDIIPGQATVRGALDREIIRRIIRRHINEVKFCYEAELTKKPELAGRVSIQFTISGAGQVIASVLQSSTMNNLRVESCVVQAVRRWEFPRPEGGGLVIVSYPFNFQSNSAGQ